MMGKYPTPKIHIESRKDFPQFQPEVAELVFEILIIIYVDIDQNNDYFTYFSY